MSSFAILMPECIGGAHNWQTLNYQAAFTHGKQPIPAAVDTMCRIMAYSLNMQICSHCDVIRFLAADNSGWRYIPEEA